MNSHHYQCESNHIWPNQLTQLARDLALCTQHIILLTKWYSMLHTILKSTSARSETHDCGQKRILQPRRKAEVLETIEKLPSIEHFKWDVCSSCALIKVNAKLDAKSQKCAGVKQLLVAIDLHCNSSILWKPMATVNCVVTNNTQHFFFCVQQNSFVLNSNGNNSRSPLITVSAVCHVVSLNLNL